MSPTIIEYKKIRIEIYPNDHTPVHIHALKAEYGNKVFLKSDGKTVKILRYEEIKGKGKVTPLTSSMRDDIKKLVKALGLIMVRDFERIVIERKSLDHDKIVITKLV